MIIGVDIGATKTLVADFTEDGTPQHEIKFPTPQDPNDFLSLLVETIEKDFSDSIDTISVASAGTIYDGTVVSSRNLKSWHDVHIVERLYDHFKKPVLIGNDAKIAALSEGGQPEYENKLCVYMTISTGIGIGIVSDGKLVESLDRSEAGHIVIEHENKLQVWEDFASGRAIKAKYGKFASEITDPKIWQEISENIAVGLEVIIPTIMPDVVIIGGSIGTYFERYHTFVEKLLDDRLPSIIKRPKLVQAKHPEEAVIYGCYQNAINQRSS